MSDEATDIQKKSKKTMLVILFVVIPILFSIAGLIHFDIIDVSIFKVEDVLETTDIHCYNINWFGTSGTGFQVVFRDSIDEIKSKMASKGKTIDESFFQETDVVNYLVKTCPHLDNRDQIPENYDPNIGIPVLDKCIQRTQDNEQCSQFIK